MKKSILDIDIIAVCQSACGSAGITANVFGLGEVEDAGGPCRSRAAAVGNRVRRGALREVFSGAAIR